MISVFKLIIAQGQAMQTYGAKLEIPPTDIKKDSLTRVEQKQQDVVKVSSS